MREEFQEQCLGLFFEGEAAFRNGQDYALPSGLYGLKKRAWRRGYESAQRNASHVPPHTIEDENRAYEEAKILGYDSYNESQKTGVLHMCPYSFGSCGDSLDEVRTTGWLDGEMRAKSRSMPS